MHLVCISAFYYLALAAGIVQKGDDAAYCTGSEVQAKLGALCWQPTAKAKDVANAARMSALLDALFGASMGHVRCLFARDWVLAGKPFRTTWTAGWWLTEREALTGGDAAADANSLALLGPEVQAAQEAAEAGRAATQAAQAERAAAEAAQAERVSAAGPPVGTATGALVVDTGTGEAKLLLVLDGEAIELQELGIVKMQGLEVSKALSTGSAEGAAQFEEYVSPLRKGLAAFLSSSEAGSVHLLAGLVGVTAWFRRLKGWEQANAEVFLRRLVEALNVPLSASSRTCRMRLHIVDGKDEALYELKAVEYAVTESGLEPPLATMAGGSGSIQISGLDNFFSFDAPLKEGEVLVAKAEGADRPAAVEEWSRLVLQSYSAAAAQSGVFTDQVGELAQEG